MRGAIPPLPNTHSWRCAKLKYRDNFTFMYVCIVCGGACVRARQPNRGVRPHRRTEAQRKAYQI
jgi:hypothetical protein